MTKAFLLTINEKSLEYYQDILNYLRCLKGLVYILITEHIGQSNKHYHGFVQYDTNKRLSVNKLYGTHIEKSFGSAQKNIAYCLCEDDKHKMDGITAIKIYEEGTPRLTGNPNLSIRELAELDNAFDLPDYRMYNTFIKIKAEKNKRISLGSWRKNVKCYYIQGPSAIGKSLKAEELVKTWYNDNGIEDEDLMYIDEVKYVNGFYEGVGVEYPCDVAIFDDFRADNMKPQEFINLIDYRVHNMNIKCNEHKNRYSLIIFTSVQKLSDIYRNVNDYERREQWERRLEVIDLYPPEPVSIGGYNLGYKTNFNNLENYHLKNSNNLNEVEVTDSWGDHIILN